MKSTKKGQPHYFTIYIYKKKADNVHF